jgi:hypothetical protein
VAFTVIGFVLMVLWRFSSAGKPFFDRRGFEAVSKEIADETAAPRPAPAPAKGS